MGTNPICIGAPGVCEDDWFVFDMATSAVALGKVRQCHRQNNTCDENIFERPVLRFIVSLKLQGGRTNQSRPAGLLMTLEGYVVFDM